MTPRQRYCYIAVKLFYLAAILCMVIIPDLPTRIGSWPIVLAAAIVMVLDFYAQGLWPRWLRWHRA